MRARRVTTLVVKELKKLVREPANLFMALLFPMILTVAFGSAFGGLGSGGTDATYTVGMVDLDASVARTGQIPSRKASRTRISWSSQSTKTTRPPTPTCCRARSIPSSSSPRTSGTASTPSWRTPRTLASGSTRPLGSPSTRAP